MLVSRTWDFPKLGVPFGRHPYYGLFLNIYGPQLGTPHLWKLPDVVTDMSEWLQLQLQHFFFSFVRFCMDLRTYEPRSMRYPKDSGPCKSETIYVERSLNGVLLCWVLRSHFFVESVSYRKRYKQLEQVMAE